MLQPAPRKLNYIRIVLSLLFKITLQARSPQLRDLGVCSWSRYGSLFPLQTGLRTCPAPVDQSSAESKGEWAPWSYPPYCVTPEQPEEDGPDYYCLYTSTAFRNNHGISIVTTPDLAASIADLLDDSSVLDKHVHHPSSSMNPKNKVDIPYDIEDLPGRGKGVIARRAISQWDIVMVGWPALVLPVEYQTYFSVHQRRALLSRAVKQLPLEQRTAIMSLARSTGGEFIEDIIRTNIFGIELDGIPHIGLFPEGSRVNHNCKPNTYWRYAPHTMTMEVVALRDIMPGEEVSHSYVVLGRTSEERKDVLSGWGFNCSCWLCTASPKQIKAADTRRERIQEIHASLVDTYEGSSEYVPDEEGIQALADELFALVDQEELWPQLVVFYEVVARAYMEIAEWQSASKYAALSEREWIRYGGEEHDNVDGINALWAELIERASVQ